MAETRSFRATTLVVMAATFTSRLLGFVRNAVVGALFGQTWKADVLNAVFSIPFNLRKLVAEGALSTAFIPVLSRTLVDDPSGSRSKDLARSLFSLQVVILLPFTVIAIVFAPQIVAVLAPFHELEKQILAVELFRWFINYLFLVSISAVMMAVLNTHHKFAVPAVSPVLFSLSVILSLVFLFPSMNIYAQIPGVLFGGLAQILFQAWSFKKLGYSLFPKIHFWTPALKETVKKWVPALSISVVALLNQQISITLAATLKEGSVSALSNAIVFWQLPAGVLSASVITVFFPRMSRQAAEKDWERTSQTMTEGLEIQALLLIPAGFLLAFFSEPIISLAFQRNLFTYQDSVLAGQVLFYLSWGLFFSGAFNFLQRFFYAKGDFKTPFYVNFLWAGSDLCASLLLMQTPLGVRGLAVGSLIGFVVGSSSLLVLAWRKLPLKRLFQFLFFTFRVFLALLPSAVLVLYLHSQGGPWWKSGLNLVSLGLLFAEGLGGLILIFLSLLALGIQPWRFFQKAPQEVQS